MVKIKCRECGNEFEVKGYNAGRVCFCSDACRGAYRRKDAAIRQRAWRQTERGKASTVKYNSRFKRPEIELVCLICGDKFKTAHKRKKRCDKSECKAKASFYNVDRCRKKNADKYRFLDAVSKVARRHALKCGGELKCEVCGEDTNVHLHHFDYKKKKETIPLCPKHHKSMHSWDSK